MFPMPDSLFFTASEVPDLVDSEVLIFEQTNSVFAEEIVEFAKSEELPFANVESMNLNDMEVPVLSIPETDSISKAREDHQVVPNAERPQRFRVNHYCNVCLAGFTNEAKLGEHMQSIHNIERPFECNICGQTFRTSLNIARHKRSKHDLDIKKYSCERCKYTTYAKKNLEIHERRHSKSYAFPCDLCGKGFMQRTKFEEHKLLHDGKGYECQVCKNVFHYKRNLVTHIKCVHPETVGNYNGKLLQCKYCPRKFTNENSYKRHHRVSHKNFLPPPQKSLCDLCGMQLSTPTALRHHMRGHKGEKVAECDVCGKSFSKLNNLKVHKRIHTGEKPYKCTFCDKGFTQRTSMVYHVRVHKGERPYQCSDCGKSFISNSFLRKHVKTHEKSVKGNDEIKCNYNGNGYALHDSFKELDNIDYYKIKQEIIDSFVTSDPVSDRVCDFCGETFAYLNRLVAHLSTVHGIERPFKCPLCDKDYPHRFMLNAHARKHHGFSLVACAHCSYSTMDRTKLERHIRKLHNNELPVSVAAKNDSLEYISEEFSSYLEDFEDYTSSLEASISFPASIDSPQPPVKRKRGRPRTGRTKRPDRTYLCTYCGKELKTIKGLQIHTRLHTGEKPFTCPYCDKRFSCETLLRTHRVTHTGERPYRCDLCGKTFTQRSTLVVHKRYHSGERPYVCERCSKGFVTRTLLNSHLKSCF